MNRKHKIEGGQLGREEYSEGGRRRAVKTAPNPPLLHILLILTSHMMYAGCSSKTHDEVHDTDSDADDDSLGYTVESTDSETGIDTGDTTNDTTGIECIITVHEASLSEKIGTVGIVTWSTSVDNITEAHIDFGLDTEYGLTAPVDIDETNFRTLLLGMKENRGPYHFRITAAGSTTCVSEDYVFDRKTDARPADLELPETITHHHDDLYGGFFVTTEFRDDIMSPMDYAFILDADGDLVWWYLPEAFGDLTAAKMSYDGKYMWLAHGNVPNQEGRMGRVRMDGEEWEDRREDFPWLHHDFTVLPDETVAYLSYNPNECDDIIEVSPEGKSKLLMNSAEALYLLSPVVCHGNAIQYSPFDDTYVISDTNWHAYFKIDRDGNVLWVLNGGESNQFDNDGGGATGWIGNHNLHLLDENRILFFNNGSFGDANDHTPAVVRELLLDMDNMTTEEIWSYASTQLLDSQFLGDVQRLPNGNTLVTYSGSSIVHEVNAEGELLQEIIFQQTAVGYSTKRETLYGPPPR